MNWHVSWVVVVVCVDANGGKLADLKMTTAD